MGFDLIDLLLHLDEHLRVLVEHYGAWTYGILFLIVFCETGFVITPFLPGDSLLFAAGSLAALLDSLNVAWLCVLLSVAAIAGDTINYGIGAILGPRVFNERIPFLKQAYLERTHAFYERHGGKTIILARFIPIIRTFAPFVAGVGRMTYPRFLAYNVIGGVAWVLLFVLGGYYFGALPIVQQHFELVIVGIIGISLLPGILEYVRHRLAARRAMVHPPC